MCRYNILRLAARAKCRDNILGVEALWPKSAQCVDFQTRVDSCEAANQGASPSGERSSPLGYSDIDRTLAAIRGVDGKRLMYRQPH